MLAPFTNLPNLTVALAHSTLRIHLSNATRIGALISAPASPDEGDEDRRTTPASLRVGLVIHRARDGYAARANTLQSFLDLNRQVNVHRVFLITKTLNLSSDALGT